MNMDQDRIEAMLTPIVMLTLKAPLERAKIILQTQGGLAKQGLLHPQYNGITDCYRRLIAHEGVTSLWRGNVVSIARLAASSAPIGYFLLKPNNPSNPPWEMYARLGAVGAAGLLLTYPLDYVRTRLAADVTYPGRPRQFNDALHVCRQTWKVDGIRGFYRGIFVSALSIPVYRGFYFVGYDGLRMFVFPNIENFAAHFALSYAVVLGAGVMTYPMDTIRRRMMMTSCATDSAVRYRWGSLQCAADIVRTEGILPLFRGVSLQIAAAMVGASMLAARDYYKTMALADEMEKK